MTWTKRDQEALEALWPSLVADPDFKARWGRQCEESDRRICEGLNISREELEAMKEEVYREMMGATDDT